MEAMMLLPLGARAIRFSQPFAPWHRLRTMRDINTISTAKRLPMSDAVPVGGAGEPERGRARGSGGAQPCVSAIGQAFDDVTGARLAANSLPGNAHT